MNTKNLLTATLLTAILAFAGCVEGNGRASVDADGDCWASQGPGGQSAGCEFGDGNGCQAEQGWRGQSGSCGFSG